MCFLKNIFTIKPFIKFKKSSILTSWEKCRLQITLENKAAVSANELVISSLSQASTSSASEHNAFSAQKNDAITEQLEQLDF